MLKEEIHQLLTRDLDKLKREIEAYEEEALLWEISEGIANSAGNLCLHLLGNLNTYVGSMLGNTGYIRNRPAEFSQKNVPRAILLEEIDKLGIIINQALLSLPDQALKDTYPDQVLGVPMSTAHFLGHLAGHLNYHLGQINYHRRILTGLKQAKSGDSI
jgi:uncharacterized damage-inducible protein DinB